MLEATVDVVGGTALGFVVDVADVTEDVVACVMGTLRNSEEGCVAAAALEVGRIP